MHLQYAGNLVAPCSATLRSIRALLWARMGVPKDTPLLVWEEVKYQDQLMINPVDQDRALVSEQIVNGDLLILQEELKKVRPCSILLELVRVRL